MAEWPDWTDQAAAIVASGPSTNKAEVESLEGRLPVLAIKKNAEIAPWADVVYGCDYPWWRAVRGLPDFKGLKAAYAPKACADYGCKPVLIPDHANSDELRFETTGTVGGGGCSGFQALNLAVQFGATKILLIGFDCQDRSGVHWYGRNIEHGMSNPSESNFRRWIAAFARASEQLRGRNIEVVNASTVSAVKSFPVAGVAETLERWGV